MNLVIIIMNISIGLIRSTS